MKQIIDRTNIDGETMDDVFDFADYKKGVEDVRFIRCMEHFTVPQLNHSESSGAECGACIRNSFHPMREALQACIETLRMHCDCRAAKLPIKQAEEALRLATEVKP